MPNIIADIAGTNLMRGKPGADVFDLLRDGFKDYIWNFQDGVDRIDLTRFDVTWDSVMVQQISLTEYKVFVRDEFVRVTFEMPAVIPPSGSLLDETDFIFDTGRPEPPVQSIFEDTPGVIEVLRGTPLPDVFILQQDMTRDNIEGFEPGKDRIDLSDYNVSFGELRIQQRANGKVGIVIIDEMGQRDALVVRNPDKDLTAADITADMFIF